MVTHQLIPWENTAQGGTMGQRDNGTGTFLKKDKIVLIINYILYIL